MPPETSFRPPLQERLGQRLGVLHGEPLLGLELLGGGQQEADRLAGDDVLERPALQAGEDGLVEPGGVLRAAEAGAAAGAGQRLVRGGGDPLAVREGRGMDARRPPARRCGPCRP